MSVPRRVEHLGARAPRAAAPGGAAARAGAAAAPRRPAARAPPRWSPKCAAPSAAARSAQPPAARIRAGSGSTTSCERVAVLAHERGDLGRREPLGGRVGRDVARSRRSAPRSARGTARGSALRPWYLPWSISRVPGGYLRSSHGWLKNVAFMIPVASTTVASTSGFIPRRRTGRERDRAHLDDDGRDLVRRPARRSCAPRERSRGRCSSRSPTVCEPEPLGALARGAP